MSAPRVLLLDVMDTLVADPFRDAVPAVFGLTLDAYFGRKCREAYLAFEGGEITRRTYARTLFTTGEVADLDAFSTYLRAHYRLLDGIGPLLDEVAGAGIRCVGLTNYGAWYRLVEEATGLSRWLDWSLASARTGLRKPDPACFEHAIAHTRADPARTLFVDDRDTNVLGGRAAGVPSVRFSSADALRRDLIDRGWLSAG